VETVGIILLVFFLVVTTLAAVATVKAARAVKRGVERKALQARRAVEDQRLRARSFAMPGPFGQLAQVRLDLRTSIDSTFQALDGAKLPEADALLARLNDHAQTLDAELKLLEREPDRSRVSARLRELTERARRIAHSADSLRWAVQDRAEHAVADDLEALTREIDMESSALRHWESGARPGVGAPQAGGKPLSDGPARPAFEARGD